MQCTTHATLQPCTARVSTVQGCSVPAHTEHWCILPHMEQCSRAPRVCARWACAVYLRILCTGCSVHCIHAPRVCAQCAGRVRHKEHCSRALRELQCSIHAALQPCTACVHTVHWCTRDANVNGVLGMCNAYVYNAQSWCTFTLTRGCDEYVYKAQLWCIPLHDAPA